MPVGRKQTRQQTRHPCDLMVRCRIAEERVAKLELELQRAHAAAELLRDKSTLSLEVPKVPPLPKIPRKRKANEAFCSQTTVEVQVSAHPLQDVHCSFGPRRDALPSVISFCLQRGMSVSTESFTAKMARLWKAPSSVRADDLNLFWLPISFLHLCRRELEKPDGMCASLPVQARSQALRRATQRYNDRMTLTVRHLQQLLTLVGLEGVRHILGVAKFDATGALKGAASRVVVTGRKTTELCTPSRILSFFDKEFRREVRRLCCAICVVATIPNVIAS